MNLVYITTCLVNDKQYIGSHKTNNINDGYLGSGILFKRALKKYGKKNFKRTILKECLFTKEARLLEEPYIKRYNTLFPNGYNLSNVGGANLGGNKLSQDHKNKIAKNNSRFWKGKKRSDEDKLKMSLAKLGKSTSRKGKGHKQELIEKYGEDLGQKRYDLFIEKQRTGHLGKKESEETKEKKRQAMLGKNKGPKSLETRNKISKSLKGRTDLPNNFGPPKYGEDHPNFIKLSDDTKQEIIKMHLEYLYSPLKISELLGFNWQKILKFLRDKEIYLDRKERSLEIKMRNLSS